MLTPAEKPLRELLTERIVLLDGAMGTMIQRYKLDEAAYRGERFREWPRDVKGNNDLLVLTQPEVIREIHAQYVAAGADIIETNTFSSTTIAQADYGMGEIVPDINRAAARTRPRSGRRPQGTPHICRRRDRTAQSDALDFA